MNQAEGAAIGHHVEGIAISNALTVNLARVLAGVAGLDEPRLEVSLMLFLRRYFLGVIVVVVVGSGGRDFLGTVVYFHCESIESDHLSIVKCHFLAAERAKHLSPTIHKRICGLRHWAAHGR